MKKQRITLTMATIALCAAMGIAMQMTSCAGDTVVEDDVGGDVIVPPDTKVVTIVAHGAFIDADGDEIELDRNVILATQEKYIRDLESVGRTESRGLIYELVGDRIIANALYIDELLNETDSENRAWIEAINNGLRFFYFVQILGEKAPAVGDSWTKGIDGSVADDLEDEGIEVLSPIVSSGEEYQDSCRAAGVPVPRAVYSDEWVNLGDFDGEEFISGDLVPELWGWKSEDPPGVCLALPRHIPGTEQISLFGVICLGKGTGKACMFDNPNGVNFERYVELPLDEFVGGADLADNGQGVCTDCHAGENPFVVHPDLPPFTRAVDELGLTPRRWHEPLVVNHWPQNPGPSAILDAVSSPMRCSSCHRSTGRRGFPILSEQYSGYCMAILDGVKERTMPPPDGSDFDLYQAEFDALKAACRRRSSSGEIVQVSSYDEQDYLSPPKIFEPLVECAQQVTVLGAQLDAELTLVVNGTGVETRTARRPSGEVFDVPELRARDELQAVVELDGESATSETARVRYFYEVYYHGLPTPIIDEPVHECASALAVVHAPGAQLIVYSNDDDPTSRFTSTGYSVAVPSKRPFEEGDEFTAEVRLCGEVSDRSEPVRAIRAPSDNPPPIFAPPELFVGQELVNLESLLHGATTTVSELTEGELGDTGSWPVSWYPDFDLVPGLGGPIQGGQELQAQQVLCQETPMTPPPPVLECDKLPAPAIEVPFAGDEMVGVVDAVPGARIIIFDESNDEIGDGSGSFVILSRPLVAGEAITAIQKVGECLGRSGYRATVLDQAGN